MAEKAIQFNRFDLGILDQERDLGNGYYSYLENLELKKRGAKQIANVVSRIEDKNLRALLNIGGTVYGLGWQYTGAKIVTVWNDLTGTPYASSPATGYTFTGKSNPFFIYSNGYIYFDNLHHIGRYTISGRSMNGDWCSLSRGLNGGLDWHNYLWGFQGQDIYQIDVSTGIAGNKKTIPLGQTIVKLLDYGNLMAIVCSSSVGESKMFLWDGVDSTTSFYDIIKIGHGTISGVDILDGMITAVISLKNYKGIRIKKYNGNIFITDLTYYGRKNIAGNKYISCASQVKVYTNYLYFLTYATRPNSNNDYEYVLMRYGREDINKYNNLSVYKSLETGAGNGSLDYNDFIIIEDTAPTPDYPITAICATILTDTDITITFHNLKTTVYTSQAGIIETGIYTGGDSSIEKKLFEMSIQCVPLISGQSIVLKYKPDADTDWTTIVTMSEIGTISYEPTNEATGNNLRTSKEVAFRIEQLGGAELTGFYARYEEELGQK